MELGICAALGKILVSLPCIGLMFEALGCGGLFDGLGELSSSLLEIPCAAPQLWTWLFGACCGPCAMWSWLDAMLPGSVFPVFI
jgi:hypothetical protein